MSDPLKFTDFFSPEIISVNGAISLIKTAIHEVYERVKMLEENEELRKCIERQAKWLGQTADELEKSKIENFPQSCSDCLQDFKDSISECSRVCAELKVAKNKVVKFCAVRCYKGKMESLEKSMEKAQQNLQFALIRALYQRGLELEKTVERGQQKAEAIAIHPNAGIFKGAGTRKSQPYAVSKPKVSVENDLIELEWTDTRNCVRDLKCYEVCYSDGHAKIWPCKPEEHKHSQKKATFTLALGPPKVCAGRQYTISVRAVNSRGPGEWSQQVIARFKIGPPNQPARPKVVVKSPTEVTVETSQLNEKDENGSPVHQCVVVYNDTNASEPSRLSLDIKHCNADTVLVPIKGLSPNTTYIFQVIMVNEAGESLPSGSCEVVTTEQIPGPPQELRASSKRTSSLLKIRWKEPRVNPHAVCRYQIQIRGHKQEKWYDLTAVDRKTFSVQARNLPSGQKFHFRACAIDSQGQRNEFSNVLETKTRRTIRLPVAKAALSPQTSDDEEESMHGDTDAVYQHSSPSTDIL